MALNSVNLVRFTAFERLELPLSEGINVFVGANGTGKTHIMKVLYAACDISKSRLTYADKLTRVFMPSNGALGRLVKRHSKSTRGTAEVIRGDLQLRCSFSNHATTARNATETGIAEWMATPVECVYIPVKEMLSNAPGFRSLYNQHDIHFEEVYADILDRAFRPALRGPADAGRKKLLKILQTAIDGKVEFEKEEFFLRNKQGNLEFSLLAEGMRKLGLLWLLIQNGTLINGSVLFWDEPETNLNPKLFGVLVDILLSLQRAGVQVFIATHDYVLLKEIDLRGKVEDPISFHSLYRSPENGELACHSTPNYLGIHPNAIAEAFADLYDREVSRSLGGKA